MAERPADRMRAGRMTPNDLATLDQAYQESVDDLRRLLAWVRELTEGEADPALASARVTLALDEEPEWDRLMLVTTLGVALVRLAQSTEDGGR